MSKQLLIYKLAICVFVFFGSIQMSVEQNNLPYSFFYPQSAFATPPKRLATTNLIFDTHSNNNSTVSLFLSVVVDEEEGLAAILRDGASVALVVDVDLSRKRSFWSNANVFSVEYSLIMRYNSLTREFSTTLPNAEYPLIDRNFSSLLQKSWTKIQFPLGERQLLVEDAGDSLQEYRLTINIGLQHTEVPPWLANSSLFWSAEVTPMQTITRDFTF